MNRFIIGNVIKIKEGIIGIVYDVKMDGYTQIIPFDSANCSIGLQEKTYERDEIDYSEDYGEGTRHKVVVYGTDDAELIAYTVKDWIIKSLTKGFGF